MKLAAGPHYLLRAVISSGLCCTPKRTFVWAPGSPLYSTINHYSSIDLFIPLQGYYQFFALLHFWQNWHFHWTANNLNLRIKTDWMRCIVMRSALVNKVRVYILYIWHRNLTLTVASAPSRTGLVFVRKLRLFWRKSKIRQGANPCGLSRPKVES